MFFYFKLKKIALVTWISHLLKGYLCLLSTDDIVCNNNKKLFKGATKLYFMHYSCVVIILFNTDLYKSEFVTYFFRKTSFSSFCALYFLFIPFRTRCNIWVNNFLINSYVTKCTAILFSLHTWIIIWTRNVIRNITTNISVFCL